MDFEITIRRALRQAGYTGATPGGQPFGKAGGLDPRNEVPATHSASLRAFTPVFDGLWTRVNAPLLSRGAPRGDERKRSVLRRHRAS